MKKLIVILVLLASATCLTGCKPSNTAQEKEDEAKAKELVQQAHKQIKEVNSALDILKKQDKTGSNKQDETNSNSNE